MTLNDWLKITDVNTLDIVVWVSGESEEDGPLWEGPGGDIPYWVANCVIETDKKKLDYESPISFRSNLGEDHKNRPGFVVVVKDYK